MSTRFLEPRWNYLRRASHASLRSFELSRLNHAANLRKEITVLINQWIEEIAAALLARWLREHFSTLHDASLRQKRFELEDDSGG